MFFVTLHWYYIQASPRAHGQVDLLVGPLSCHTNYYMDPLEDHASHIVSAATSIGFLNSFITYSERVQYTRAASAFSEDLYPITSLVPNKWRPPMLPDETLKRV